MINRQDVMLVVLMISAMAGAFGLGFMYRTLLLIRELAQ